MFSLYPPGFFNKACMFTTCLQIVKQGRKIRRGSLTRGPG
ncbi:hypothetical protein B4096_3378 [Heyndrickxia coagulans]|nr:hypothetical protein B4096_3378 [Heyndrickxia coagulans]